MKIFALIGTDNVAVSELISSLQSSGIALVLSETVISTVMALDMPGAI